MPEIYSRRKGADPIPAGAVYVGRGSAFGNPFVMQNESERDAVCASFAQYAEDRLQREPNWLVPLRGKHLVCFCQYPSQQPKKHCHAETLVRLANTVHEGA